MQPGNSLPNRKINKWHPDAMNDNGLAAARNGYQAGTSEAPAVVRDKDSKGLFTSFTSTKWVFVQSLQNCQAPSIAAVRNKQ